MKCVLTPYRLIDAQGRRRALREREPTARFTAAHRGVVSQHDLRPIPEQELHDAGMAFAVVEDSAELHPLAKVLGRGRPDQLKASSHLRYLWWTMTGVRAEGETLCDLLWSTFHEASDPTGRTAPKPGQPFYGDLILPFGRLGVLRRERFKYGEHPHTEKLRELHRIDYRRMKARGGPYRKWVACVGRRYDLDDPAAEFADVYERHLQPATKFPDDFDGTNDLTWTDVSGTWNQTGGILEYNSTSNGTRRAEHPVSDDDHKVQANIATLDNSGGVVQGGPAARFSSSAETCYIAFLQITGGGSEEIEVWKVLSGFPATQIGNTEDGDTFAIPDDCLLMAVASMIFAGRSASGGLVSGGYDTSITGNNYGGLYGLEASGSTLELDNYEIDDLHITRTMRARVHN